ncbi:MAG: GAF domain-containing sensor histidine kinase [Candidatus Omnitrophica bacterium]|nr:GAF domain-containing sensor histidine kinase [Candidatus Omnitrophota bacterium]
MFKLNIGIVFAATSAIIVGAFVYLVILTEKQKKARGNLQRSLDKLKKAYDELDEQAKIIVKKDLELNKTQEELDKKINSLYTLHKLSKAISSTFDAEKLFSQIDKTFISELGFDKGLIVLASKDTKELSLPVAVGYPPEKQEKIKKFLSEKNILNTIRQPLLADKSLLLDAAKKELLQIFDLSSLCLVPIISQEARLGLIMIGTDLPYARVTEGDLEILSILSGQIAGGVENAKLYEELWQSHQYLEQRVAQRTKELASANEKLKKIDKLKSEFVSAVSHELRTPLTSIKGYAAILMAGKLGVVPAPVKERLEKINKHSDSLTKLVNDLLDISRIESGKVGMKLEKLNLKDVVNEVVDITAPQIKEKKIQLAVDIPGKAPACLADKVQLGRVLTNLLGNAIKFTPEKGKISIKAREVEGLLQIDVRDSGIGIGEEELAKIFDEFYREDNAINQKIKGAGLGLSLVKHIVEAHKGKVWVSSKLGCGATFCFTLPKA